MASKPEALLSVALADFDRCFRLAEEKFAEVRAAFALQDMPLAMVLINLDTQVEGPFTSDMSFSINDHVTIEVRDVTGPVEFTFNDKVHIENRSPYQAAGDGVPLPLKLGGNTLKISVGNLVYEGTLNVLHDKDNTDTPSGKGDNIKPRGVQTDGPVKAPWFPFLNDIYIEEGQTSTGYRLHAFGPKPLAYEIFGGDGGAKIDADTGLITLDAGAVAGAELELFCRATHAQGSTKILLTVHIIPKVQGPRLMDMAAGYVHLRVVEDRRLNTDIFLTAEGGDAKITETPDAHLFRIHPKTKELQWREVPDIGVLRSAKGDALFAIEVDTGGVLTLIQLRLIDNLNDITITSKQEGRFGINRKGYGYRVMATGPDNIIYSLYGKNIDKFSIDKNTGKIARLTSQVGSYHVGVLVSNGSMEARREITLHVHDVEAGLRGGWDIIDIAKLGAGDVRTPTGPLLTFDEASNGMLIQSGISGLPRYTSVTSFNNNLRRADIWAPMRPTFEVNGLTLDIDDDTGFPSVPDGYDGNLVMPRMYNSLDMSQPNSVADIVGSHILVKEGRVNVRVRAGGDGIKKVTETETQMRYEIDETSFQINASENDTYKGFDVVLTKIESGAALTFWGKQSEYARWIDGFEIGKSFADFQARYHIMRFHTWNGQREWYDLQDPDDVVPMSAQNFTARRGATDARIWLNKGKYRKINDAPYYANSSYRLNGSFGHQKGGIPIGAQILTCRETNTMPHLLLPTKPTRQYLDHVVDQLNKWMVAGEDVIIEERNEVWNYAQPFKQGTDWFARQGRMVFLTDPIAQEKFPSYYADGKNAARFYYGMIAVEDVLYLRKKCPKLNIYGVNATQTGARWDVDPSTVLNNTADITYEAAQYYLDKNGIGEKAGDILNFVLGTGYIHPANFKNGNPLGLSDEETFTRMKDNPEDLMDDMRGFFLSKSTGSDYIFYSTLSGMKNAMAALANTAKKWGAEGWAEYESGSHATYISLNLSRKPKDSEEYLVQSHFTKTFNKSQQCADCLDATIMAARDMGAKWIADFERFTNDGPWSEAEDGVFTDNPMTRVYDKYMR